MNTSAEIGLHEEFSRFMRELKGPDWEENSQPRALKAAEEHQAIEYPNAPAEDSVEALSRNIIMNQFAKTTSANSAPLAIEQAPEDKMETKFRGTMTDIKLEGVTMLDANGNQIGSIAPQGAVSNPVMNPIYAAMYTPYLSSYNYLMQNPNVYYSTIPQGIINIRYNTHKHSKHEFIIGRLPSDAKKRRFVAASAVALQLNMTFSANC